MAKFGDVLRYPLDADPQIDPDWVFMYLSLVTRWSTPYIEVLVLRAPWQDDQWTPGDIIEAGVEELIPYVLP